MGKRKQNKKPTNIEIAQVIIEAVAATAALISAIRWW